MKFMVKWSEVRSAIIEADDIKIVERDVKARLQRVERPDDVKLLSINCLDQTPPTPRIASAA